MKITITGEIDLYGLESAIYEKTEEVTSVDGVGSDGESTYVVNEVSIKDLGEGKFTVTFDLDHESGKFASKDEVAEEMVSLLDDRVELDINWEA